MNRVFREIAAPAEVENIVDYVKSARSMKTDNFI